jgi:predicted glutamine amidotransferase
MCRWMAWLGQPVLIEELLFNTQHGIVDQSLHARMGAEPTNGDGFGLGWYGGGEGPAVYRSVSPAWADANLRELAAHTESPLFFTHIRAAIGSPVQETNCHPFRRGRWLFVHNGFIADFHLLRRDLMLEVAPELFAEIHGSTDTEVVFYLALTLGLEHDPLAALEKTVGPSRRRQSGAASPAPSRRRSECRTAKACGPFDIRPRAARVRCSLRPTSSRYGAFTPRTRAFGDSAVTTA